MSCAVGRADNAAVVAAANTPLATSEAANPGATSTSTVPAVMTDSYTFAISGATWATYAIAAALTDAGPTRSWSPTTRDRSRAPPPP